MKTVVSPLNQTSLTEAAKIISSGGVVAFPTETVYGLGASVFNEDAVKKIFEAKGRPMDNPLIVHVSRKEDISLVAKEIPEKARIIIDKFMPGPITVVLKKRAEIPYAVTGGIDTVGVRIPSHEGARAFISACGVPIPAPSANSSGKPSPTSAAHVFDDLDGKIPLILDGGECSCGVESTVISLCGEKPVLLRPGMITYEMLCDAIGEVLIHPSVLENGMVDKAASPGMKYKHYSPKARAIIVDASKEKMLELYDAASAMGKNPVILWKREETFFFGERNFLIFYEKGDTSIAARNLFALLRKTDELGFDTVFIQAVDKSGAGLSVMNRMLRASAFTVLGEDADEEMLKSVF